MTSIPSQFPPMVTATRPGALQALALQAGQTVDGRIVGAAPNGGVQVEIRGQMLNLLLPMPVNAGETIRFEVQGSGQNARLAVQLAQAALPASGSPATQVQISAAQTQPAALPPGAPPQTVRAPAAPMAQAVPPGTPQGAQAPLPGGSIPAAAVSPQAGSVPAQPVPVQVAPVQTMAYPQSGASAIPAGAVAAAATGAATMAPAVAAGQAMISPVVAVGPVPQTGSATANLLPAAAPVAQPATPQAALAQMVQAAVPRQAPISNLTAALTAIAGRVVLPEPVVRAAQQVLAGRVALEAARFDGAVLQAAVKGSGVFQEAQLARGQVPLPQVDMKSALLALRQTLVNWLGTQAPVAAVAPIPPPLKGAVPRARHGGEPAAPDPKAGSEQVGRQLLERTESALARVRLHQHAALPEAMAKTGDWSMDLPVMVGAYQSALHLQIHRDQHNESDPATERGWQMRFAINLPGMGEVGAQISLRAGMTGVMLWAAEAETSAALEAEAGALRAMLADAGLQPGAVVVRHGEPVSAAAPQSSGHFVDAQT